MSLLWYFRPPLWLFIVIGIAAYVLIKGWPSVLWEYEYRNVGTERYKVACYYWNPSDGVHYQPAEYGKCSFLIGGRRAYNS